MDKIIFHGNIGRDAEYTEKDGRGIAKFTVAVTHFNKGEKTTEWRGVTAFGKTAEFCQKYATKGRTVLIEGRPSVRCYKNKLDEYVATMDVLADSVECIGGKAEGDQNTAAKPAPAGFVPVEGDGDLPF